MLMRCSLVALRCLFAGGGCNSFTGGTIHVKAKACAGDCCSASDGISLTSWTKEGEGNIFRSATERGGWNGAPVAGHQSVDEIDFTASCDYLVNEGRPCFSIWCARAYVLVASFCDGQRSWHWLP
jgi:hypothetical protein